MPRSGDETLVVDIDLSILGRDAPRYDEFEQRVRKEYRWVPLVLYRRKRIEILESFLKRPRIYGTDHFHARYEEQARRNLQRAIQTLRR